MQWTSWRRSNSMNKVSQKSSEWKMSSLQRQQVSTSKKANLIMKGPGARTQKASLQSWTWRQLQVMIIHLVSILFGFLIDFNTYGQAGLAAAFQVPIPGDSGSSPDASSISNYCLPQEIFTPTPADCCPSISLKQCFGQ